MSDQCGDEGDRPTAVDLFAGAGGASCGIVAAGFNLAAAVDHDPTPLDTHADNLPGYTIRHDLTNVDASVLPERARKPTYLHGSPPCKGFSTANDNRDINDERNSLVFRFAEWLDELQPRVTTMENVTGMTSITSNFMDRVEGAFRDAGYAVRWRILNAADYGVPQTRRRVITVGVREDLTAPSRWFPRPTHAETETTTLDGRELSEWVTVEDAIGDLGVPVGDHRPQGENNGTSDARWRGADEPSHTLKGQGSHTTRADGGVRSAGASHEPSSPIRTNVGPQTPRNHVAQDHGEQARERFRDILAGRRSGAGLSGRVARLQRPSPTITADETAAVPPIRPPNHNPRDTTEYEPHDYEDEKPATTITGARLAERGHHDHNWDGARRLTVRECARLQSFPDWFVFSGTKTSQYAQVGNAVPPRLQYHITRHLRNEVLSN